MGKWYIHWAGELMETAIYGDTLVEAIEANFEMIGHHLRIGNVAGWVLDKVTMAWEDGILGGKGGVVLTINAYGSPDLVNYTPEKFPKQSVVWIQASKSDCPAPYTFEFERSTK